MLFTPVLKCKKKKQRSGEVSHFIIRFYFLDAVIMPVSPNTNLKCRYKGN